MANIGPLVAKITANAEGVSGGVNDAIEKIEAGGKKIEKSSKDAGDKAGSGLLSGLKTGLNGLGGVIGGAMDAAAATAKIGAAGIGAAVAGGVAAYMAQTDKIRGLEKGALTAGVNVADLQTIQALTGDLGVATSAMQKFSEKLSEAAAFGAVGNDGFARLGIDAAALAGRPLEALGVFSDKVNGLGATFEKLQAVERVFGSDTVNIFGAIERGSAGIAAARKQMDAFGATMTTGMIAMIKQADVATRAIGMFKDGIFNQITIGAGAVLAELGDRFGTLGVKWESLGRTIVGVIEKIVQVGNSMYELAKPGGWSKLWDTFIAGIKVVGAYLESAIVGAIGRAMKAVGMESWGKGLVDHASMSAKWAAGAGSDQLGHAYRKMIEATERGKAISGFFDAARGRIGNMGMAGGDDIHNRFSHLRRITEGYNASELPFDDIFSKLRQGAYALSAAPVPGRVAGALEKLLDPNQGPLAAALARSIDPNTITGRLQANLLGAMQRGVPAGVQEMLTNDMKGFPLLDPRGRTALGLDIFNSLKQFMPTYQPVGAMERGSREAYSAVTEYQAAGRVNIEEAIRAAVVAANEQRKEQIKIAEQTLRAIKDAPRPEEWGI